MCAMFCVIGASEQGVVVSSGRIRVSGLLSRGRRGMILTTKDDHVWIVESDDPTENFAGSAIVVEGTIIGIDRLRADWIGFSGTGA